MSPRLHEPQDWATNPHSDTQWSIFLCCDASLELLLLLLSPSLTPLLPSLPNWKSMQRCLHPPRGCVLIDYLSAGERVAKMGWGKDRGKRHRETLVERERVSETNEGEEEEVHKRNWQQLWMTKSREEMPLEAGARFEFAHVAQAHFCTFTLNCIFWPFKEFPDVWLSTSISQSSSAKWFRSEPCGKKNIYIYISYHYFVEAKYLKRYSRSFFHSSAN